MKRFYSLVGAIAISLASTAQVSDNQYTSGSAPLAKKAKNNNSVVPAQKGWSTRHAVRATSVFTSDFSNPADWNIYNEVAGTSDDWVIGTAGPAGSFPIDPIASTTAANGFALFDSDNLCSGDQSAFIETANSIDCSSLTGVIIRFEQFYRKFSDQTFVEVSNDGTNWTQFEVNSAVASNSSTSNPAEAVVNISSVAANEATVWVRFHFLSGTANGGDGCDYAWMVDDVSIEEAPANNMAFNQYYFNGFADSTFSSYYTFIPEIHANLDTINFGGVVENIGSATQTNVALNVNVSGQGTYNGTSAALAPLATGATDSADVTSEFYPNSGQGNYDIDFFFTSDSTDEVNGNDTGSFSFEVTGGTYGRDLGTINSGNWYDAASNIWEVALYFEINAPDTGLSISAWFPDLSNGYGIDAGDPLSFYLYNETDLNNPVGSNEFYTVVTADEDGLVTLPITDASGNPPTLAPGGYYASVKVYTDETAIGTNSEVNGNTPPFVTLVNVDESSTWSYSTTLTPFIRLNVKGGRDLCAGVSVDGNATVVDNLELGSIDLTATGGSAPYSYSWTASNGGSVPAGQNSAEDLTNISSQGTYTVVITDVNGCTSNPIDFTVGGIVSTNELTLEQSIGVFPNPSTGVFTMNFDGLAQDNYTITILNVVGQQMQTTKMNLQGSGQQKFNLEGFESGIYFLNVEGESGAQHTFKLIKK